MCKSGIEPARFLQIVNGSLFQSHVYEAYGRIIACLQRIYEPCVNASTEGG